MTDTTLPDRSRSAQNSYDETIKARVSDDLADDIDRLVEEDVYDNRSEAIRELLRLGVDSLPPI